RLEPWPKAEARNFSINTLNNRSTTSRRSKSNYRKEGETMNFGASTFIWVSPFSNKTLGLVKKVRDMGFDIIEVCIEDPATIDAARIREALAENNTKSTICGAFGPDRDASSEEKSVRANAVKYLESCIDTAKEIGAPFVAGPMYSAVGKT